MEFVDADQVQKDSILVACEGVPALLHIKVDTAGSSTCVETVPLSGNALDVTFVCAGGGLTWTAVVSVDHVHVPGSTTAIRGDYVSHIQRAHSPQPMARHAANSDVMVGPVPTAVLVVPRQRSLGGG